MKTCPFCALEDPLLSNALAVAAFDSNPVTDGHLLVITRRHVADWFDCSPDEHDAIHALLHEGRQLLDARFVPAGYNVGVNVGEVAGQTIMHVHVHLIPRYRGDMSDPRGGVRGVIPDKQWYPDDGVSS